LLDWHIVLRVAHALGSAPLRRLALAKLGALTQHDRVARLVLADEFAHPAWFAAALRRGPRPDIEQAAHLHRALTPAAYRRVADAAGLRWSTEELAQTPQSLELEEYRGLIAALMATEG
jgi:hypothetical protein